MRSYIIGAILKFLDKAKIYVQSGHGGCGSISFRREKYIEFGGPNGGNGGRGSDIILQSIPSLNTLIDFRYQQHFKGKTGKHGMGRNCTGRSSDPIIIKVPIGTQVFTEDCQHMIVDMIYPDQKYILCHGGHGGRGNTSFKSSMNQSPKKSEEGFVGTEMWIWLKLKMIADIGIIGLNNTGKSSFLAHFSNARPKIADFPFSTLYPQIGVVNTKNYEKKLLMIDTPGLIKGASDGYGLGKKFLVHIERCKLLIHLIDCTHPNPINAYYTVKNELQNHTQELINKPEIILFSKTDKIPYEILKKKCLDLEEKIMKKVFTISYSSQSEIQTIYNEILRYMNKF